MTIMREYPVRCCCQPTKVFGYLQVPDGLRDGDRYRLRWAERDLVSSLYEFSQSKPTRTHDVSVLIRTFVDMVHGRRELAIYSEDRPIEFWRTVPTFRELKADDPIRLLALLGGHLETAQRIGARDVLGEQLNERTLLGIDVTTWIRAVGDARRILEESSHGQDTSAHEKGEASEGRQSDAGI